MGIRSLIADFKGRVHSRRGGQLLAPPTLSGAFRFPYGAFQFKSRLVRGATFVVEATTDFKTWQPIANGVAKTEEFEYLDSEAGKFAYRFYRLTAQALRSANLIGYASVALPPGFSMIANPLRGSDNTIGSLFKDWPDGTSVSKFDTMLFRLAENVVKETRWTHPAENLLPSDGAIFFNPTSDYKSHSFVGDVFQGDMSLPIPAGFSVRSSLIPQPGSVEDLGFPIANGDVIHLFDRDRQRYVLHPYENDAWKSGPPVVNVGESFWVAKTHPGNWSQKLLIT